MGERTSCRCLEEDEELQDVHKGTLYQEDSANHQDWAEDSKRRAIDFDLQHQIARLRIGKNMSDGEAGAIFSALADGVRSYDQVVEVSEESRTGLMSASHTSSTSSGRADAGCERPIPSMDRSTGERAGAADDATALPCESCLVHEADDRSDVNRL